MPALELHCGIAQRHRPVYGLGFSSGVRVCLCAHTCMHVNVHVNVHAYISCMHTCDTHLGVCVCLFIGVWVFAWQHVRMCICTNQKPKTPPRQKKSHSHPTTWALRWMHVRAFHVSVRRSASVHTHTHTHNNQHILLHTHTHTRCTTVHTNTYIGKHIGTNRVTHTGTQIGTQAHHTDCTLDPRPDTGSTDDARPAI